MCSHQAALLPPHSLERLLLVSAFVVSTYNTLKRTDAPFESLQNATYELVYPEKGIRMIMERVGRSQPLEFAVLEHNTAVLVQANTRLGLSSHLCNALHQQLLLPSYSRTHRGCHR